MVPHLWLKKAAELVWLPENIKIILFTSLERWTTILTANKKALWEVNITQGIFQEDTLFPLLFVILLIILPNQRNSTRQSLFAKAFAETEHIFANVVPLKQNMFISVNCFCINYLIYSWFYTVKPDDSELAIWRTACNSGYFFAEPAESQSNEHFYSRQLL